MCGLLALPRVPRELRLGLLEFVPSNLVGWNYCPRVGGSFGGCGGGFLRGGRGCRCGAARCQRAWCGLLPAGILVWAEPERAKSDSVSDCLRRNWDSHWAVAWVSEFGSAEESGEFCFFCWVLAWVLDCAESACDFLAVGSVGALAATWAGLVGALAGLDLARLSSCEKFVSSLWSVEPDDAGGAGGAGFGGRRFKTVFIVYFRLWPRPEPAECVRELFG